MDKDQLIASLQAENQLLWGLHAEQFATIQRLQRDCAEAYQILGTLSLVYMDGDFGCIRLDDFDRALDNVKAAMLLEPRPHEELLPWPKGAYTNEVKS